MEDHARADTHTAAHGEPHIGAGGCVLKEAAAPGDLTAEMKRYNPYSPSSCVAQEEEVKELEKQQRWGWVEEWGGRKVVLILLLLLAILLYFQ